MGGHADGPGTGTVVKKMVMLRSTFVPSRYHTLWPLRQSGERDNEVNRNEHHGQCFVKRGVVSAYCGY